MLAIQTILGIIKQRRELLLFSALIVFGQAAGVFANIILAKHLGPIDYAPIALLFSTTAFLVVLALSGLSKYLNREIVEQKRDLSAIVPAVLFSFLLYTLLYHLGSKVLAIEFFYFYGLLSILAIYLATLMQVLFKKLPIALFLGFARFVKLASAVVLVFYGTSYRPLLENFSSVLLSTMLLVIIAAGIRQRWKSRLVVGLDQLRGASPFLVSMSMYFIYYQSSILILGYYKLDEILANFSIVITIYSASIFIPQLYYHKYRVSHFYALDKPGRVQFVRSNTPVVIAVGLLSAVAGWLVIWGLVAFYFDGEYSLARHLYSGMTLAVLFRCVSSLYDLYCHSATLASRRTLVQVIAGVLSVTINLVLIPVYGAYVVVFATVLSELFVLLGYLYLYRCSVKTDLDVL